MDDRAFVEATFVRAGKELPEQQRQAIIELKSELHHELIKDELPLFPGVETFLKATSRRYALSLVSMARRKEIDYVLDRARLGSLFTVMISAEDVRHHKPNPECYRIALERQNAWRQGNGLGSLRATDCVAIEDAPPGIEAARTVGMRTIGITNTVSEPDLRAAGADVVTRSLADWTADAVHHLFD
jgi:HAD superfamily hydrolase (TIGR01509 family)